MAEIMTADQKEKAKATLRSIAQTEYKKISKAVSFMEEFREEIVALNKTGHPWSLIAMKLEAITKTKISATTLRNHFKRGEPAARKRRPESVDAVPNVFQETELSVENHPGFERLKEPENRSEIEDGQQNFRRAPEPS